MIEHNPANTRRLAYRLGVGDCEHLVVTVVRAVHVAEQRVEFHRQAEQDVGHLGRLFLFDQLTHVLGKREASVAAVHHWRVDEHEIVPAGSGGTLHEYGEVVADELALVVRAALEYDRVVVEFAHVVPVVGVRVVADEGEADLVAQLEWWRRC